MPLRDKDAQYCRHDESGNRKWSGDRDAIDVDEVVTALAKTVAELTYGSEATLRQRILDTLMREISEFESEFANAPPSDMRH